MKSEKTFRSVDADGKVGEEEELPCWQDGYDAYRRKMGGAVVGGQGGKNVDNKGEEVDGAAFEMEEAEVFMSLVVPAYNEDERLGIMLKEATDYLQHAYGDSTPQPVRANGNRAKRKNAHQELSNGHVPSEKSDQRGWEVLVVSDGSTDNTIDTALQFAKGLGGSVSSHIRVIQLRENRGKGGAVTHGMRHVRGQYAVFADADGASKFEDLGKLVRGSQKVEDVEGKGVAVGSRAHLVGSEAVVKVPSLILPP